MNNYIVLDSYKYMTRSPEFEYVQTKAGTARYLHNGSLDVSYGVGLFKEWRGPIIVPVTAPDEDWGNVDTIRATLAKLEGVSFSDHYGTSFIVHIFGEFAEKSLSPKWDGTSNEFYIPVRILAE